MATHVRYHLDLHIYTYNSSRMLISHEPPTRFVEPSYGFYMGQLQHPKLGTSAQIGERSHGVVRIQGEPCGLRSILSSSARVLAKVHNRHACWRRLTGFPYILTSSRLLSPSARVLAKDSQKCVLLYVIEGVMRYRHACVPISYDIGTHACLYRKPPAQVVCMPPCSVRMGIHTK